MAQLGCRGPARVARDPAAQVAGTPFDRHRVATHDGIVTYYLAPSPEGPRPLLVVLQGSGCGALFTPPTNGKSNATAGQDLIFGLAEGRFAVLVVEKPGVIPESDAAEGGTANDCSPAFRAGHSLPNWVNTVWAAVEHARGDPHVDGAAGVRVLGMSEGAITAARLAREHTEFSHIAFISGFGCNQWRDMLVVARRNAEAAGGDPAAAVATTEAGLLAVSADPFNPNRLFEGQTHLFWSTFGLACPADDLAQCRADVLVAYGTADEQVDSAGVEAIPAARLAAGRQCLTRRVIGGNHVLNTPGSQPFANLVEVFRDSLDWMSGGDGS